MKRSILLLLVGLQIACSNSTIKDTQPADNKPNILIILVDDLGKEWVSSYGSDAISTPNIDALARSGTKFSNVYSMPQCTPSRLSILTGQYPFRHGWVNHWDVPRWGGGAHFDETLNPSLGIEMKKAGYKTCIAGKWQIDDFRVEPDALTKNGFDKYCMWTGYETGVPASAERYQDPYLFTSQGSKTYDGKFGPDVFKDFIIDFINTNKDSSMFIYFPMVLTHTPFVDTPDETAEDNLGKHKAMVRYVDKITGELVQALENANIRNNTLIIWTTDNGTTRQIEVDFKGKKIKGGKMRMVEPGISAPFIASWPDKVNASQESDALVDFTDFFPTCLDLGGISPKENWMVGNQSQSIDGRSFKNVLLNNYETERDWILAMGGGNYARLTNSGVENQFVYRDRVLRDKQYKLYVDSNRQPDKFIDLINDPFEEINLIDSLSSDQQEQFDALVKVASSFPERDNDPRYIRNPAQEWDVEVTAESQVWKQ